MKAWHFTNTNEPLVQAELPEPVVGPGEVIVKVRAAGLCHTDVGVLHDEGWLSTLAYRPIVMGHEVAGEIAEVGDGVTDWAVGDRVGVCPTTSFGAPGFTTDGGFGEKVKVPATALVRIPDNVSFALGAAGVKGVAKSISELGDDFDVIVDDAGFGTTTAAAIENVRLGGRVVQVGMGKLEATISTKWLILKSVTLVGSQGGTIEDVQGVYDYFATGQIQPGHHGDHLR